MSDEVVLSDFMSFVTSSTPLQTQELQNSELHLQGIGIAPGIARGVLVSINTDNVIHTSLAISKSRLQAEITRFRTAVKLAIEQLEALDTAINAAEHTIEHCLLLSHLELLRDTAGIQQRVIKVIESKKRCAEESLRITARKLQREFKKSRTGRKYRHFQDIEDIVQRILDCLKGQSQIAPYVVPDGAILAVQHLPLSLAFVIASRVKGFITSTGSTASHAAIFARARGVPFVTGISMQQLQAHVGKEVEIDGGNGLVRLTPGLAPYESISNSPKINHEPFQLACGHPVEIAVNVEHESYVEVAKREGVKKIGLLRTEYFFLDHEQIPSKGAQVKKLRTLFNSHEVEHAIIRVFDVSWDKFPRLFKRERGVAFLLKHVKQFRIHVQAIFAAVKQPFSILLPFVNCASEVDMARKIIKEEIGSHDIPIGAMIETPWAVLRAEEIVDACDFVSIGSNDLLQYSLGVDRSSILDPGCESIHRGVFELLMHIQQVVRATKKPCHFCGEMAADPVVLPLLIDMGFSSFSLSPYHLPALRSVLRTIRYDELCYQQKQATELAMIEKLKAMRELVLQKESTAKYM